MVLRTYCTHQPPFSAANPLSYNILYMYSVRSTGLYGRNTGRKYGVKSEIYNWRPKRFTRVVVWWRFATRYHVFFSYRFDMLQYVVTYICMPFQPPSDETYRTFPHIFAVIIGFSYVLYVLYVRRILYTLYTVHMYLHTYMYLCNNLEDPQPRRICRLVGGVW